MSLTKRAGARSVCHKYGSGSVPRCYGSGLLFFLTLYGTFLGVFVLETEIVTGGDGERGDHSLGLMDTDQENRVGPHREKLRSDFSVGVCLLFDRCIHHMHVI
jgi:hypothetical protein